jgi:hypothetical protein
MSRKKAEKILNSSRRSIVSPGRYAKRKPYYIGKLMPFGDLLRLHGISAGSFIEIASISFGLLDAVPATQNEASHAPCSFSLLSIATSKESATGHYGIAPPCQETTASKTSLNLAIFSAIHL